MRKLFMFFIIAVLSTVLVACGSNSGESQTTGAETSEPAPESDQGVAEAEEEILTITHQLGETPVPKNPERVIAFDFGALDSLDKLGIEVIGLAKSGTVPSYLSKFEDDKYENVGSLKEPDFEKINALQPDLIIISGRQQDAYEELNKIAPTIFLGVDTSRYMESFTENMQTLAKIFDKEAEVEAELAQINEDINSLYEKASASGEKALIVLANDGKVSAYGPSSRFGIIHDLFGFAPADENIEVSTHGQSISFEYIVEQDPDYLFVIDRGASIGEESSAQQVLENELVERTKAYQNGKIIYLAPDNWYLSGGGLVSVSEMVKEVAASLD